MVRDNHRPSPPAPLPGGERGAKPDHLLPSPHRGEGSGVRRGRADEFVGRVLEASIARFVTACFELESAPPLGALVVTDDTAPVYAVVADVRTEGREPGRRPTPHGGPHDDRARVLEQNPHIPALLQTTFEAAVAGHNTGAGPRPWLPDAPPPIFARVRECTDAEVCAFTASVEFCSLVLAAGPLADEVLAACLRRAAASHPDPRDFLVRAGKALAVELAAEPHRLAALLRRIRP